jgi:hypothetical protein
VDKPGIYWAPVTQEMVDTPTRKFTVIHLVNPSPDDSIQATTLPAPMENVGLTIKPSPGAKIVGMTLVRPDSEPYAQDLKLEKPNSQGAYEIKIPQIAIWAMVIVEESGTFQIPPEPPRFTNPVDEAELAAGRKAPPGALMLDPLQQPTRGVTLKEASVTLGVTAATLRQQIANGKLSSFFDPGFLLRDFYQSINRVRLPTKIQPCAIHVHHSDRSTGQTYELQRCNPDGTGTNDQYAIVFRSL